ncbi:putative SIR2 family histone deacetylase [Lophium mytilinum]|uniref:Putative SIR2 family histone deacetylase n=1 Tax=Lophium mytilinum TaxID=390894 RepID=A0A6A6QYI0_9PEZI|nr:putative SIR2 family histone deacetylase [Lophium mytilinum]
MQPPTPPSQELLDSSTRILALFGAGLSAASGLPTYRSPSSFWRAYSGAQLATFQKFSGGPALVWRYYEWSRAKALAAAPNEAHVALARLARVNGGLVAVNQNAGWWVVRLCKRAGHPATQIVDFHGLLFRVRCVDDVCGYEVEDFTCPITPALALPSGVDVAGASVPLPDIGVDELPHCPKCESNLLRPAVLWFGEGVPEDREEKVEKWLQGKLIDFETEETAATEDRVTDVDLMLVVGTSAVVYPAVVYIAKARERGARVAFFNMEVKSAGIARPEAGDWSFVGDATVLVPQALEPFLNSIGQ